MNPPSDIPGQLIVVALAHKRSCLPTNLFRFTQQPNDQTKIHQGHTFPACPQRISMLLLRPLVNTNIRHWPLTNSSVWVALSCTSFHTVLVCRCLDPDVRPWQKSTCTDRITYIDSLCVNWRRLTSEAVVAEMRINNENRTNSTGCKASLPPATSKHFNVFIGSSKLLQQLEYWLRDQPTNIKPLSQRQFLWLKHWKYRKMREYNERLENKIHKSASMGAELQK